MKCKYDFNQLSKMNNYFINSSSRPVIPFNMKNWMFNNLCEKSPSTLSDCYDKFFLLRELYNSMCSDSLRNYCLSSFNEPFKEV